MKDLLVPVINELSTCDIFTPELICYQTTQGRPQLRSVLSPTNIVLGAGCNAVLENLCFCLADQFFLESDASTTHAQCPRTKLTGVPIDKNSD
mmetsp:Transcript_50961/g.61354  ORF Transcript_50961/g.61354 Transcript_50961/m.61354 type:complete len:93 (-) Transcript_50961:260-538(-)